MVSLGRSHNNGAMHTNVWTYWVIQKACHHIHVVTKASSTAIKHKTIFKIVLNNYLIANSSLKEIAKELQKPVKY